MNPINYTLAILLVLGNICCSGTTDPGAYASTDPEAGLASDPQVLIKRREDGTLSSINQVDEQGIVHGTRVTYYSDGKTVYSKLTFDHGFKQGTSIRYYENGQVFELANFENGKKHGPQWKYYKSGELMAEYTYEMGYALPGLKEYERDGSLVSDYPEISFREVDHLASSNRMDLEISCTWKKGKMKYFVQQQENGESSRIYLITENGSTTMQFYVPPGETLHRKVDIIAEIPTKLGNILVLERSYPLQVSNKN